MALINSTYEHNLAYCFHQIDNRGLLIDTEKKALVRVQVEDEIQKTLASLESLWNVPLYIGIDNKPKDKPNAVNINASAQKLQLLKDLGYDPPKIRKKNEETDEYEMKEGVGELVLVKLLADPTRWPNPQAGEGIKKLLELAETTTFRTRYLNARLYHEVYYTNYNVAATVTGRRGSKKNIFGIGGNSQNFPSRGRLSDLWKECIIARPGKIFFFVDQVSAEDWPVQALSENHTALDEMRRGVNRHYKFASQIFGITVDDLKNCRDNVGGLYTKEQQDQAEMQYYMGKKGRHANNYGMQPTRFSEALAAEGGFTVPVESCKNILNIIDRIDPNVKRIFHKYITDQLAHRDHKLCTPLGRERQFLGLRSGEKNYSILNESYAYIPQSTVGDNTGLAVVQLEKCHPYVLQDGHDSLCQEVPDNEEELLKVFHNTKDAFKRTIRFHNGIEIEIPIEGQIGYDWKHKVKMKHYTEEELLRCYRELQHEKESTRHEEEIQTTEENKCNVQVLHAST
jgi:hypothetical protein